MSTITTKQALAASFKRMLKKKPLDKITIKDICEGCDVNRQTFYYHFQDIYDLIEWIYTHAEYSILRSHSYETWQEGLAEIFAYALQEKEFVSSTYHSISREHLENFLYRETFHLLYEIIDRRYGDILSNEEDKAFLADFYKYAFIGFVLDWVRKGMKEDPAVLIHKMTLVQESSFTDTLQHFANARRIKDETMKR